MKYFQGKSFLIGTIIGAFSLFATTGSIIAMAFVVGTLVAWGFHMQNEALAYRDKDGFDSAELSIGRVFGLAQMLIGMFFGILTLGLVLQLTQNARFGDYAFYLVVSFLAGFLSHATRKISEIL